MRQVPCCPKQDFYLRQTQYFRHNSCHGYGESEYDMNIEFVKGKDQDCQAVSNDYFYFKKNT